MGIRDFFKKQTADNVNNMDRSGVEDEFKRLVDAKNTGKDDKFIISCARFAYQNPAYVAEHFPDFFELTDKKSDAVYHAVRKMEKDGKYEEIVQVVEPFYEYLMQHKEELIENRYCSTDFVEEAMLILFYIPHQEKEPDDVEDQWYSTILSIYQRALYAQIVNGKDRNQRIWEVSEWLRKLCMFHAEALVTDADLNASQTPDVNTSIELLKIALKYTTVRGEYGLPGIYRRLGDMYAHGKSKADHELARACYSMGIFFGDDDVQKVCYDHNRSLGERIMETPKALRVIDDHGIQFGYGEPVKVAAKWLADNYPQTADDINIKDILMDPREIIEAGNKNRK